MLRQTSDGLVFGLALLGVMACAPGGALDTSTAASDSSQTSTSVGGSESESTASAGTGEAATDDGFVPPEMDFPMSCDPFAQDCDEGEKCVPIALVGSEYDANVCVAVTGEQPAGEPCTSAGPSEGTDDCDATSVCGYLQQVDDAYAGICIELCLGSADDPECSPGTHCTICAGSCPNYCLPDCDPLEQDCAEGLGCYWSGGNFECVFTSMNLPTGDVCGFVNDCAPGNLCVNGEALPSCEGSSCCAEFCELDAPSCAIEGTQCVGFFEQPPPEHESLGICMVPPP